MTVGECGLGYAVVLTTLHLIREVVFRDNDTQLFHQKLKECMCMSAWPSCLGATSQATVFSWKPAVFSWKSVRTQDNDQTLA